jgi:cyclic pyranopterin monophosphate synthase
MVDVGGKAVTEREAIARGSVAMSSDARRLVRTGAVKKGDPLQAARLAGIMAAKQTAALIPLCHPLPLSSVHVDVAPTEHGYDIEARVRTTAQTGVEMEALTAVAVAALTIYDMVKAVDKSMVIGDLRLIFKSGGRSGVYVRRESRRSRRAPRAQRKA